MRLGVQMFEADVASFASCLYADPSNGVPGSECERGLRAYALGFRAGIFDMDP